MTFFPLPAHSKVAVTRVLSPRGFTHGQNLTNKTKAADCAHSQLVCSVTCCNKRGHYDRRIWFGHRLHLGGMDCGSDMALIIPALAIGLFFGIVGIATIPELKWCSKTLCMPQFSSQGLVDFCTGTLGPRLLTFLLRRSRNNHPPRRHLQNQS